MEEDKTQSTERTLLKVENNIVYNPKEIINHSRLYILYNGFYAEEPILVKRHSSGNSTFAKQEWKVYKLLNEERPDQITGILRIYGLESKPDALSVSHFIATETFVQTLREYIEECESSKTSKFDYIPKALKYISDIAQGLEWLHTKNIIHRSVEPESIFICESDSHSTAKLGNLGLSIQESNEEYLCAGNPIWMSPEALESVHYRHKIKQTKAMDMFSFGLTTFYTLSMGSHPFESSKLHGNRIIQNIQNKMKLPRGLEELLPELNDVSPLLHRLMNKNPTDRPTIQDVINSLTDYATNSPVRHGETTLVKRGRYEWIVSFIKFYDDHFAHLFTTMLSPASKKFEPVYMFVRNAKI